MRILYSHRIQSRDGQSLHIEEIVAALRAAGHEVVVVGPSFYQAADFGGESKIVALARRILPASLAELAELAYNLPAYRRLLRAYYDFAPDLLYERYNLYYLAGAFLARRHRLLFYLEVNAPLADERAQFAKLRLKPFARALELWIWRSADRLLAVTSSLKEVIAAAGAPVERIRVVPNGVALARFPPLHTPSVHAAPHVILGFVGFVRSWHGLDEVIQAMATASGESIKLVIVGDGPARPALEREARVRGIADRVRFTGLVPSAEIPELIGRFDIALQPKAVPYASPLKIFEYMAACRAIVAPEQPNICEILEHERTALLFGPEDGAMWQAITRLAGDSELRWQLGQAARAEIERRDYTWTGNARRIANWAQADLEKYPPASAHARAMPLR